MSDRHPQEQEPELYIQQQQHQQQEEDDQEHAQVSSNETKKAKKGSGKRLNDRERVDIIQMAENSKISKRQLADKFGVSEAAIRKLLLKKDDFLRRYYDTPEDVRDQRLRGKSTRMSSHALDSCEGAGGSMPPSDESTLAIHAPSPANASVTSVYPPDDPWKHGLHAMLTKVTPFLKNFTQSSKQPTLSFEASISATEQDTAAVAGKMEEAASLEKLDWISFSRMLRDIRRALHRYPETGYQEVRTQAFIKGFCEKALQIPSENIRVMASTGLVVDVCYENATVAPLETRKLPVIAFRADMDALPIEEMNDHLPYCSTQKQGQKEFRKRKKRKSSIPQPMSPKKEQAEVEADQQTSSDSNGVAPDEAGKAGPDVGSNDLTASLLPAPSTITTTTIGAPPVPNATGDEDEEFITSTAAAHMCGHDGHMAMVLGLCAMAGRA